MKVAATSVQPKVATAVATSALPSQYRQWMPYVNEAAKKYNLDPALILGVMSRESNGHNVRGDGGHGRGLMQIDDRSWGSWLSSHNGGMDPRTNILKGAEILRDNINYFHGNVRDGVAAYNCGAGNVNKALRNGLSPDAYTTGHNYSSDVLSRTATFKKELGTSPTPTPAPHPTPSPSSKYTAPAANLTLGDHNNSVKQLQTDLVHLGYMKQSDMNTGPGIFGPHTQAALKKFQESHGIHGDNGEHYGPQTRGALTKALAPKVAPKPTPAPKPAPKPTATKYTAPAANVTLGDHNGSVKQLQTDLVHLGYMKQSDMNTGPGIFGPHTQAALKKFQESHGIHGDNGVHYGPQTRAALTKALAPKPAPKPTPTPAPKPTPTPAPKPTPKPTPTPSPTKYTAPTANLTVGDHNASVKQLQTDLVHLGFMSQASMNTGPGIFGPHTQDALAAFQNKWGIYGDAGKDYGPQTRAALTKALSGVKPPKPPPVTGTNAAAKAEKYLGRYESDLQAHGITQSGVPTSESCANFVTSMLIQAGAIKPSDHQIGVDRMHDMLIAKGWHEVPLSQAKPGDVWLVRDRDDGGTESHTELVASNTNGHVRLIGSNNHPVPSNQQINYDDYSATIRGSMILAPPN